MSVLHTLTYMHMHGEEEEGKEKGLLLLTLGHMGTMVILPWRIEGARWGQSLLQSLSLTGSPHLLPSLPPDPLLPTLLLGVTLAQGSGES